MSKLPSNSSGNSSHPRGWNTTASHNRKVNSYKVETSWYQNYAKVQDENCLYPLGIKCVQSENEWLIVMQDLSLLGFTKVVRKANNLHLYSALKWLAYFHAKYLGVKDDSLWIIGTYWHLDTRDDELNNMDDLELKSYAKDIDTILNNSKYQTIVHGDAKLANFCFNSVGDKCSAVDFQYVGHGCGMKDVAYFFSSALSSHECFEKEEKLLEYYFMELREALKFYKKDVDFKELKNEYRSMYKYAWADFIRFMKGWSKEHFKINEYSNSITKEVLRSLD